MRIRPLIFGALAAGAVLTACGGGSTTATAGAGSSTTAAAPANNGSSPSSSDAQAQRQAYTQCLQQHGVTDVGAGRRGGNGQTASSDQSTPPSTTGTTVDPSVVQSARQACQSLLPAGGLGGTGGGRGGQAFQAYAQCLQQHGVTIPTTAAGSPPPSNGQGGPGGGGPFGSIDRNDPNFQAAQQASASLLPQFGNRGNGGSTSTTVTG